MNTRHVVIVPYYCEEEIDRYLKIAERMRQLGKQNCEFEFMLAASPLIQSSGRLHEAFQKIAPTIHFRCPTKLFGYPQGSTAMFWDCMDHLAAAYQRDGGFGLWLESDMVPVKCDWLDRIAHDWNHSNSALVMGCFVPQVIKRRFLFRKSVWIAEHVNGGACYAKNFATETPDSYRSGTFDMAIYPHLKSSGRFTATQTLAFSTIRRCRRDMANPQTAVLHGFWQDKDEFVQACVQGLAPSELAFRQPSKYVAAIQNVSAHLNLRFFKRGRRAMLQALLLEQDALSRSGALMELAAVKPENTDYQVAPRTQIARTIVPSALRPGSVT